MERLLDLDLECSLVDVNGWTPLTHASAGGHAGCVGLLLAAGASVGGPDVHGRTPLHWAAERGWVDVITLLVPAMMLEGQDLGLQVGQVQSSSGLHAEWYSCSGLAVWRHLRTAMRVHNDAHTPGRIRRPCRGPH